MYTCRIIRPARLPTEFNTLFFRHAGKLGELSQHIGAFQHVRDFIPSLPEHISALQRGSDFRSRQCQWPRAPDDTSS
jgi:hypothetical protein